MCTSLMNLSFEPEVLYYDPGPPPPIDLFSGRLNTLWKDVIGVASLWTVLGAFLCSLIIWAAEKWSTITKNVWYQQPNNGWLSQSPDGNPIDNMWSTNLEVLTTQICWKVGGKYASKMSTNYRCCWWLDSVLTWEHLSWHYTLKIHDFYFLIQIDFCLSYAVHALNKQTVHHRN